jgi:hypothetical protein
MHIHAYSCIIYFLYLYYNNPYFIHYIFLIMANPWLSHVKKTMKSNRGLAFKQVLRLAKKSYRSANKMSSKMSYKSRKGSRRFRHRGGSGLLGEGGVAAGASEFASGNGSAAAPAAAPVAK